MCCSGLADGKRFKGGILQKKYIFQKSFQVRKRTPQKNIEYRVHYAKGKIVPLNQRVVGTKKEIFAWAKKHKIPVKHIALLNRKESLSWITQDKPRRR